MNNCYFFVPALKLESLLKIIHQIEIKMVVIDVEDSIHAKSKYKARQALIDFDFSILDKAGIKIGLRINSINSFSGLEDIQFLKAIDEKKHQPFKYIFLPKINSGSDLIIYRELFNQFETTIPKLYSIIETVSAIDNINQIAALSDGLCFGQADLTAPLYGINETYVNYARAMACIAAAKNKILMIDTNSFEINDMGYVEAECIAAKKAGFTGKVAIHPKQIEAINKIFTIAPNDFNKYKNCIETYNNSNMGFMINAEQIVAPPFIVHAKTMLELYENMDLK